MDFLKSLDWKKVVKSRTVWINAIVASLVLLEQNIAQLSGFLPDDLYKYVAFGLPFINLWLRLITTKPLSSDPAATP